MRDLIRRSYLRLTLRGHEGQGMVEYALIIVFVALVVIGALMILGPRVAGMYNTVGNSLNA